MPLNDATPHHPCGCPQVAVYGTLRRGGINDIRRFQADVRWLGHCRLPGQLYDLGAYPGLVLDGAHAVLAEVYALTPALERDLDRLEEVWPVDIGEYAKRIIDVQMTPLGGGPPQTLPVLVYEALPAGVRGRARIAADDWLGWWTQRQG
ncbi:gamma-glutamylcyclotransferase family protein [Pantoea sp. 18069]|uniref:gamma-glutamylcyclotransferase family protein n=1 Tax=Pantoea sp. 18069 TaxID=2681415 RepID=UPI00135CCFE6|nr:gamma-glutamylcyclotransferase family protein [Pantoea sp. 18069]